MTKTAELWVTITEDDMVECDCVTVDSYKRIARRSYWLHSYRDYREVLERFTEDCGLSNYRLRTYYI